jgi:branched-chain amino acid transport system permease protein
VSHARAALVVAVVALVAAVPFGANNYVLSVLIPLWMFTGLAYAWNVISGYTGYLSFGQVTFFGIGAYTAALLIVRLGVAWPLAALAGGALAALVAIPLGGIMLRLRGPYFAIGMLGLARIGEKVAYAWEPVTSGGRGLYLPPVLDLRTIYWAVAGLAGLLVALTWALDNSRFGLRLLAIREDEAGADNLGINTTATKLQAFVLSAFFPGVLGGIYAWHVSYIDPVTAFAGQIDLTAVVSVLLGGAGTLWGPLLGGVTLSLVAEFLWARFPFIHTALFGALLIVTVLFLPRGLIDAFRRRGWLAPGRAFLRRVAAREAIAVVPVAGGR